MSKKYRGKPCVYCPTGIADTGDHIFARKFFLEARRSNLPKVPACRQCNNTKSALEHYLTTVLPFGGRHVDAATHLQALVEPRLNHNLPLFDNMKRHVSRAWTTEQSSILVPVMTVPFDGDKFVQLFEFIVRALVWHHWRTRIGADTFVDVWTPTKTGESFVDRLLSMRVNARVSNNLGEGTFAYTGVQGTDNEQITAWKFLVYEGVKMLGETSAGEVEANVVVAYTGPNRIKESAERRRAFLRATSSWRRRNA